MELSKQVTNLEISKRLKELDVKQEGYFEYYLYPVNVHGEAPCILMKRSDKKRSFTNDFCSAFTVAELGEMLPPWIGHPVELPFKASRNKIPGWFGTIKGQGMFEYTEADARGKMLIHLLENKLI